MTQVGRACLPDPKRSAKELLCGGHGEVPRSSYSEPRSWQEGGEEMVETLDSGIGLLHREQCVSHDVR
jgi:hypothetical protein